VQDRTHHDTAPVRRRGLLVAAVLLATTAVASTVAAAATAAPSAPSNAAAEVLTNAPVAADTWFALQVVVSDGNTLCLEANGPDGQFGGASFATACEPATGRQWRVVDLGNGYVELRSRLFEGVEDRCLEGNNLESGDQHGGAAFMDLCSGASGQLWRFVDAGNGQYRLVTAFREAENYCLTADILDGSLPAGGLAHQGPCADTSTQLWSIVPWEDPAAPPAETTVAETPAAETTPAETPAAETPAETPPAEAPAATAAGLRTAIAFSSTDGTATAGSWTTFTLTNTATGETVIVPVLGDGAATRAEADVAPGTYSITPSGQSINAAASFTVSSLSATEITVPEATVEAPEQIAAVEFSLAAQPVPVLLVVENVTATTVGLRWGAVDGVDVAGYQLVRTDGAVPAADPAAGVPVDLATAVDDTIVIGGLDPDTEYTFALFATASSGEALSVRSITATTSVLDPNSSVSFALRPNTIVPADFANLQAEPVGESLVQVTLDPATTQRGSASGMPGVDPAVLSGSGCAVGTPFLVTTDVAADNTFYGVVASCGTSAEGASTAIVYTDVPLRAVFSYYHAYALGPPSCIDAASGTELAPDAAECAAGPDADGDGLSDATENTIRTDPASPDTDGDGVDDRTERYVLGSNPSVADSDFDTLSDPEEQQLGTDPMAADSDGDGCWDRGEIDAGRNPLDAADAGGECPIPEGALRWESAVDASREAQRDADAAQAAADATAAEQPAEPVVAPEQVAALDVADVPEMGTGEVQVTLLWATGDDLDLYVTEPGGETIYYDAPTSSSGGALDVDDRGGDCAAPANRAENVFWASGAPQGTYTVEVRNYLACSISAMAKVQVRVGGQLIVDQVVTVGVDAPIQFTVGAAAPSGLRRGAGSVANAPSLTAASVLTSANRPDKVEVECEGEGSAVVGVRAYFGPERLADWEITDDNDLWWLVRVGATASVNPIVQVAGEYSCSLDLPSLKFQVAYAPVPINLELAPNVAGSAQASITLEGPHVALSLGLQSTGTVGVSVEWCGWGIEWPCGADIDFDHDTGPFKSLTVEPATVLIQGELGLDIGLEATLAIGVDNAFITGKVGFKAEVNPFAVRLKAVVGTSNCAAASIGASLGASVVAEASIFGFGVDDEFELWEGEIAYPGAQFEIGECPDD